MLKHLRAFRKHLDESRRHAALIAMLERINAEDGDGGALAAPARVDPGLCEPVLVRAPTRHDDRRHQSRH